MAPQQSESELTALAQALSNLRDSWMLVSMALKDELTESPSPLRDEVMVQVERLLAHIRGGEYGASE
jgi:hypothetical protein